MLYGACQSGVLRAVKYADARPAKQADMQLTQNKVLVCKNAAFQAEVLNFNSVMIGVWKNMSNCSQTVIKRTRTSQTCGTEYNDEMISFIPEILAV